MDLAQIISLIGALGIGGAVGVFLKSFFDKKLSDKKMLFEARIKAYSGITGRIYNNFLEPDITTFQKKEELIWAKFNQLLSEAILLSSPKLSEMFNEYKIILFKFHCALNKESDDLEKELHTKVIELADKILIEMRNELHVN